MRTSWSSTKFANYIRGINKLSRGTCQEWTDWRNLCKNTNPIRYYISDTILDNLQSCFTYIPDKIKNIDNYLENRFYDNTHKLVSKLKTGKFHEFEITILHSLFDSYVNWIECNFAWNAMLWDTSNRKLVPWYKINRFTNKISRFRSQKFALSGLLDKMSEVDSEFIYTERANIAKIQYELYIWWKFEFSNRKCPYKLAGYYDETKEKDFRLIFDKVELIEKEYFEEEQRMLHKLMDIRYHLWT